MVGTRKAGPDSPKQSFIFARHETFHIRDGWFCKGLEAIAVDPQVLYTNDAHHNLGLGMQRELAWRSLRFALGKITRKTALSEPAQS